MKFRTYLTILKINCLLTIIFAHVTLVIFIPGAKSLFEMFTYQSEAVKGTRLIAMYFRAISQILSRIHFQLDMLLLALIFFFAIKNFKLVYGKLREYICH